MVFTYNLATDTGKVRLLIKDTDPTEPIFQDDEITTFLALEGGVKTAAALALETIASDEALVQKVTTTPDITTNGAATARALMERAKLLRAQAEKEDGEGLFDWAEMPGTAFAERERIWKEFQRGA